MMQFLGSRSIVIFSLLFSRSALTRTGPCDETLHIDEEIGLHLRRARAGYSFQYLPETAGSGPGVCSRRGKLRDSQKLFAPGLSS